MAVHCLFFLKAIGRKDSFFSVFLVESNSLVVLIFNSLCCKLYWFSLWLHWEQRKLLHPSFQDTFERRALKSTDSNFKNFSCSYLCCSIITTPSKFIRGFIVYNDRDHFKALRYEREKAKSHLRLFVFLVTLWALTHAACVLAEGAAQVDGPPEGRQRQCVHLPLIIRQNKAFGWSS